MGMMIVSMFVRLGEHIEFDGANPRAHASGDRERIASEMEHAQFLFETRTIDANIEKRSEQHVTADAGERFDKENPFRGLLSVFFHTRGV